MFGPPCLMSALPERTAWPAALTAVIITPQLEIVEEFRLNLRGIGRECRLVSAEMAIDRCCGHQARFKCPSNPLRRQWVKCSGCVAHGEPIVAGNRFQARATRRDNARCHGGRSLSYACPRVSGSAKLVPPKGHPHAWPMGSRSPSVMNAPIWPPLGSGELYHQPPSTASMSVRRSLA